MPSTRRVASRGARPRCAAARRHRRDRADLPLAAGALRSRLVLPRERVVRSRSPRRRTGCRRQSRRRAPDRRDPSGLRRRPGPIWRTWRRTAGSSETRSSAIHAAGVYRRVHDGLHAGVPVPRRHVTRASRRRGCATPRTARARPGRWASPARRPGSIPTDEPGRLAAHRRTPSRAVRSRGESPPALLEAGDLVRFVPVTTADSDAIARDVPRAVDRPPSGGGDGRTAIEVLDGGLLTTVQDLGPLRVPAVRRAGLRGDGHVGASRRQSAGRQRRRRGGSRDHAGGARPAVRRAGVIAVTGGDLGARLDGRPLRSDGSRAVRRARRRRAVVCRPARRRARLSRPSPAASPCPSCSGAARRCSASASAVSRTGPAARRPRAGRAGATRASRSPGGRRRRTLVPAYGHSHTVRVVLGPQDDAFTEDGIADVPFGSVYTLAPQSDRVGCRLTGPRIAHRRRRHRVGRHRVRIGAGQRRRPAHRVDGRPRHDGRLHEDRDGDRRPTCRASRRRLPATASGSCGSTRRGGGRCCVPREPGSTDCPDDAVRARRRPDLRRGQR